MLLLTWLVSPCCLADLAFLSANTDKLVVSARIDRGYIPRTLSADLRRLERLAALPYYPQLVLLVEHTHSVAAVMKRAARKWYQSGGRNWKEVSEMLIGHAKSQFVELSKVIFPSQAREAKEEMTKAGLRLTSQLKVAQPGSTELGRLIDFGIVLNQDHIKNGLRCGRAITDAIVESAMKCIAHPPLAALIHSEFGLISEDSDRAYLATLTVEYQLARSQCARAMNPGNASVNRQLKAVMKRLCVCSEVYNVLHLRDRALELSVQHLSSYYETHPSDSSFSVRGIQAFESAKSLGEAKNVAITNSSALYADFLAAVESQSALRLKLKVWEDRPRKEHVPALLSVSERRLELGLRYAAAEAEVTHIVSGMCSSMAILILEMS